LQISLSVCLFAFTWPVDPCGGDFKCQVPVDVLTLLQSTAAHGLTCPEHLPNPVLHMQTSIPFADWGPLVPDKAYHLLGGLDAAAYQQVPQTPFDKRESRASCSKF